jgi:hypothetical protein
MKKSLTMLAAVAVATLSSSAFADSFGVRLGYPLGIQYTAENSFGKEKDLRISGTFSPYYGDLEIGVQADYLINKPLGDTKGLNFFYGGGVHINLATFGSYSAFAPGGQFTAGLEFKLDKTLSIFLDTSVGASFYTGSYYYYRYSGLQPYYAGSLGLNFKL